VELRKTDVARIVDLPPSPENSYDKYDADDGSDVSLDLYGVESKPPVRLKQTEFSLMQYAKRMGKGNCSLFNKQKKVWMASVLRRPVRPGFTFT
jgi:hypothetical protein